MGEYVAHAKDMAGGDATPSDVPDVLAPDLRIVFVGINPGRVSAAARAHFANPRNDFWRLLHAARLTSRLYEPAEQLSLLAEGIGVTNAAYRTTPGSGDLRRADFAGSAERLGRIARELRPGWLAFVGKEALPRRLRCPAGARRAGQDARGHEAVRPPVHLAGERRGAVARARALVPRAGRTRERPPGTPERPRRGRRRAGPHPPAPLPDAFDEWWVTPGGGREEGETDEQTLRRELEEEVGLAGFAFGPLLWELARLDA